MMLCTRLLQFRSLKIWVFSRFDTIFEKLTVNDLPWNCRSKIQPITYYDSYLFSLREEGFYIKDFSLPRKCCSILEPHISYQHTWSKPQPKRGGRDFTPRWVTSHPETSRAARFFCSRRICGLSKAYVPLGGARDAVFCAIPLASATMERARAPSPNKQTNKQSSNQVNQVCCVCVSEGQEHLFRPDPGVLLWCVWGKRRKSLS